MLLLLFFTASVFLAFSQSPKSSSHDANCFGVVGVSHRAPTNSERCVVCHRAEVEGYERTSMAHSLRRAGQEPSGTVTANGSTITMRSESDGYWQTWENGADKTPYRVDYVVGSGNHASGYLVEIGGHLFQSPVAYYKTRQTYDLAPGFEGTKNPDFTRPISEECLLCHSGRALPISGTVSWYRSPPFDSESISCERCHGPVERHLRDPRAGTIVNPAKLEPAARDGVCEQCHLLGAARVANPGKKLSDFVPGQPLEDTFTIFHDVTENGASGDFKVISHVEQLARSACARNSGGKMWCGTCHDPHDKPAEPVAYYRERCLSCHAQNFPVQPQHPARDSDCLTCHMPKRDAKDGGHSAFTDHRIQRRPVDAAASEAVTSATATATATNIAAWREGPAELRERNLGIAYIDAGIQRRSSPFVVQGYRMLTEVQRQFSNDPEFFKSIGQALLRANKTSEAKVALERARELDPQSATTEASLAGPYLQDGNWQAATEHLERALALDPLNLPAASTLLELYAKQGKEPEAASLSEKITAAFRQTSHDGPENGGKDGEGVSGKKAEENYKNIDVLRGLPAAQVIPAMQFIAASLGVDCQFCHVEGHFDKDDRKNKRTARAMMRMVASINGGSFDGQRQVTCYSCHRGRSIPAAMEDSGEVSEAGAVSNTASGSGEKLPTELPTVSEIIERYVSALGGAAAIEAVSSRHESGVWEGAEHGSVETFADGHGKYALVRHSKSGIASAILNGASNGTSRGKSGQIASLGHTAHEMSEAERDFAALDADLQRPMHFWSVFRDLKEEYPEKIGDNEALVVVGELANDRSVKFYFDRSSGLLLREVRFASSVLGEIPTQIDYTDYREADGVRVPMQVTVTDAHAIVTMHFDDVRQNVAIDPHVFTPTGPRPRR